MTVVFVLFKIPANLLSALLIILAWVPTELVSREASISALGTKAATESTTIKSIAFELANNSVISKASSPELGWDNNKLSISTPNAAAYSGSIAFSASIKAALPPSFCVWAIACKANVVLPEDSGP